MIVFASIVLMLLLLEAVVRAAGQTDVDGQFSFMGYMLEPFALPVSQLRTGVEGYIANESISAVIHDEKLGWTYRPDTARQAGTFTINGSGLRSTRDYSAVPRTEVLRIALFGDSFTAGDDVSDEEVWGHRLEVLLNQAGIKAEVLNFGVGAYGMDQAFLRWREQGRAFAPDIVIFGLQPENLARNLNVFRQLMHGSGPPFSKPRFLVRDNQLKLINSPTLPPEQLIAAFERFSRHPLARYEFHYDSRYVVANWWASSRLAGLLYAALKRNDEETSIYEHDAEGGQLGLAIVDAFAKDVAESGAVFSVVHLPLQWHLLHYYHAQPQRQPPFQFLLDHCRERFFYTALEEHIGAEFLDDAYWTATKHYGPEIHTLVAEVIAQELITCLSNGVCRIPRLEGAATFLAPTADPAS